jgi:uncharacterized protein
MTLEAATPSPPGFPLLIKPAGADCNLRCDYCFYRCKADLYPSVPHPRMAPEVLERIVSSFLATDQPQHVFLWQGGEPTLMGGGFFRAATDLQVRHGRPGAVVSNGLMTNGLLLDDAFAAHLAEYRFLVGLSLDGPERLHDRRRRDASGRGSHARALLGFRALARRDVACNALILVHRASAGSAPEIYGWLVAQGLALHHYVPCVEFDPSGRPAPWTLTGAAWGRFLCDLFDAWHASGAGRVSIRLFDALVERLAFGETALCSLGEDCRRYFLVEHDGDLYPCDFFVEPRWRIGNVRDTSWDEARASSVYREFGLQKARRDPACSACPHLDLCAGDCLKHRTYGGRPPETRSWLCEGWRGFFEHARHRLEALARPLRRGQAERG